MSNYLITLELPSTIRRDLGLLCNGLAHMQWVEEDNFQIILSHFGPLSNIKLAEIKDRLATLSSSPFEIILQGLGSAYTKSHIQLWVNPLPSEPILKLKHKIDQALMDIKNLPIKEKGFKPFVLLGQAEKQVSATKLADYLAYHSFYKSASIVIDHFALVCMQTTPKRVLQQSVEKYPLLQS